MSRRHSCLSLGLLLLASHTATAQELRVVTERQAVANAVTKHPSLAAAVSESRRARLAVDAEEARLNLVLHIDSGLTRGRTPSLSENAVSVAESDSWVTGAELRKELVWGTKLALRAEGSRQRQQAMSTVPASAASLGPGYGAALRLQVTQPILKGAGRDATQAELERARLVVASADYARDRTASGVLRDVVVAYWELYYATEALNQARQSLVVANSQSEVASARVAKGSLAPVEQLSFATRVATLKEQVADADALVRRRSAELAQRMGIIDERVSYGATLEDAAKEYGVTTENLIARALEASFELREQRQQVRMAELAARTASEPYRPRLDVDAYVQAQGLGNRELSPAIDQIRDRGAVSAYIGLTYEGPIDGTQREAESARARLAVRTAEQQLLAATNTVTTEVETTRAQEISLQQRRLLAEQTAALSEQQAAAEQKRFATGTTTALEVSTAQDQWQSAKLRLLRARIDLVQTQVTLAHLCGVLLAEWAVDMAGPTE